MTAAPPPENGRCPVCEVAMGQEHMSSCRWAPSIWTGEPPEDDA